MDIRQLIGDKPVESEKTGDLDLGLMHAQREIHALHRDGNNTHHNYRYVSAETAMADARTALLKHNLVMQLQHSIVVSTSSSNEGANDKQRNVAGAFCDCACVFRIVHPESQQYRFYIMSVPIVPESGRPPDKAKFAAETGAWKYVLRGALLLPWQDDGGKPIEPCARDDRNYKPPTPPRNDGQPAAGVDVSDTDNGDGTRTVIGVIAEHKLATTKAGKAYAQFAIGDYKLSSFEAGDSAERVAILTSFEQRTPVRCVIKRKDRYWNLVEIAPAGGETRTADDALAAAPANVPFIEKAKMLIGGPGKMKETGGAKWWEYLNNAGVKLLTRDADIAGTIDREFETTAPGELRPFQLETKKTPKGAFEILWAEPVVGAAAEDIPF